VCSLYRFILCTDCFLCTHCFLCTGCFLVQIYSLYRLFSLYTLFSLYRLFSCTDLFFVQIVFFLCAHCYLCTGCFYVQMWDKVTPCTDPASICIQRQWRPDGFRLAFQSLDVQLSDVECCRQTKVWWGPATSFDCQSADKDSASIVAAPYMGCLHYL